MCSNLFGKVVVSSKNLLPNKAAEWSLFCNDDDLQWFAKINGCLEMLISCKDLDFTCCHSPKGRPSSWVVSNVIAFQVKPKRSGTGYAQCGIKALFWLIFPNTFVNVLHQSTSLHTILYPLFHAGSFRITLKLLILIVQWSAESELKITPFYWNLANNDKHVQSVLRQPMVAKMCLS